MTTVVKNIDDLKTELYKHGDKLKIGILSIPHRFHRRIASSDVDVQYDRINITYELLLTKKICDIVVFIPGYVSESQQDFVTNKYSSPLCDIIYLKQSPIDYLTKMAPIHQKFDDIKDDKNVKFDIDYLNDYHKSFNNLDGDMNFAKDLFQEINLLKRENDIVYKIQGILTMNHSFLLFLKQSNNFNNNITPVMFRSYHNQNGFIEKHFLFFKVTDYRSPLHKEFPIENYPTLDVLKSEIISFSDPTWTINFVKISTDKNKLYEEATYDDFVNGKLFVNIIENERSAYLYPIGVGNKDMLIQYPTPTIVKNVIDKDYIDIINKNWDYMEELKHTNTADFLKTINEKCKFIQGLL